jgi:hypothetical protein
MLRGSGHGTGKLIPVAKWRASKVALLIPALWIVGLVAGGIQMPAFRAALTGTVITCEFVRR